MNIYHKLHNKHGERKCIKSAIKRDRPFIKRTVSAKVTDIE